MANNDPQLDLQQLIEELVNLPSPPAIAVQILNTVKDAECSLEDLEKIISADPALASKMLRIANSAFYSLPHKVSNIARALSVLGTNVIKNIALSFVIAGDFRGSHQSSFNFNRFWKNSVTTAVAAEIVMETINIKNDDIFVTALLQNVGELVLFQSMGDAYLKIHEHYLKDSEVELISLEKSLFNFDHQQVGFLLLENWGIPQTITQPIRYHHQPEQADDQTKQTANILNVASLLATIYSTSETAENVRELQSKMKDYFGISPEKTTEILDDVAIKCLDVLEVFEIDPGEIKPYSQLLQEANDELGKLNLSYEHLVLELKESKIKSERFANELRRANEKLEQLAFKDGLTQLYNHRYFQEILKKEMARSKRYNHPLSLIFYDIDFFKKVNDTYGHPAGDKVLRTLSKGELSN